MCVSIDLIARILGDGACVDLTRYNTSFLEKTIQKRCNESGIVRIEDYGKLFKENEEERTAFLDNLHVNYSEFFRNSLSFSVLERILLPKLFFNQRGFRRNEIRIWSAACASGQESYSLAMLLEELRSGNKEAIHYLIFATDQSKLQVQEARDGQFLEHAIGNLSLRRISRWFTKKEEVYFVKPELKKQIDFSVFDLFNDQYSSPPASIYGDFDLIFCANLLFYYKKEYQNLILQKVGNSLAKGGFLITGETEREILLHANYQEVFPQSGIFQKKE